MGDDLERRSKWTVKFAPGVYEEMGPELAAKVATDLQLGILINGPDAFKAKCKRVVFINDLAEPCVVCQRPLVPDEEFDDTYVCTATPECDGYSYCLATSEDGRKLIARLHELDRLEADERRDGQYP